MNRHLAFAVLISSTIIALSISGCVTQPPTAQNEVSTASSVSPEPPTVNRDFALSSSSRGVPAQNASNSNGTNSARPTGAAPMTPPPVAALPPPPIASLPPPPAVHIP